MILNNTREHSCVNRTDHQRSEVTQKPKKKTRKQLQEQNSENNKKYFLIK